MPAHLTPAQVRGARAMLGWSMYELARNAGVSVSTIKRFETSGLGHVSDQMLALVDDCLSRAGATFLNDDGNGPGVRVR